MRRTPATRPTGGTTVPFAAALLYAGIVIGVSFIAVPAKFLADSITLAQALDVGRWTFRVYGAVDLAMAAALVAAAARSPSARRLLAPALVAAMALAQALVLRPILDSRLQVILDGGDPPRSHLHEVYGALEALKVLALLAYAFVLARRGRAFGARPVPGTPRQTKDLRS